MSLLEGFEAKNIISFIDNAVGKTRFGGDVNMLTYNVSQILISMCKAKQLPSITRDCIEKKNFYSSDFICYFLKEIGLFKDDENYNFYELYTKKCMPISKAELMPGDLVFNNLSQNIYIYLGNDEIIEFLNHKKVSISIIDNSFNHFGRIRAADTSISNEYKKIEEANCLISTGLKSVDRWDSYIKLASNKYKVDPNLIKSVIIQESNGNCNEVSSAGAIGLMQVLPNTALEHGYDEIDMYDPLSNIMAGTSELKAQMKNFNGNLYKAISAYNCGANNVYNQDFLNIKETTNYREKVLQYYNELKDKEERVITYNENLALNEANKECSNRIIKCTRERLEKLKKRKGSYLRFLLKQQ
ncbi:transglycosylase SLT domain-containing protein [Clostridium felsineum]|uniref:transglycosylase SLT domain-containing protein n=1 Tax=Clostridium felsineum TaxID=36839 RepID=UPI00214D4684|nr:transglycosylase SLT domain-containing protein [Clostridium felsineum]MCR3758659.1 transglycosylase SLT domain-containing protein [Clostridium felsineum]